MTMVHKGPATFEDRVSGRFIDHKTKVCQFDDFLGDTLNTDLYTIPTKGSDAATVDFTITSGTVSGIITGTTGAGAGGTYAVNGIQLGGALQWKANQGNLEFEARVKISAITNVSLFVGLSDQVASLEEAASLSGTTYTTTASDAAGFLFDTAATTDTIRCVGVKADVDGTHVDTVLAPVADTYITFGVRIDTLGNATYLMDGSAVGYVANAVTPTVALAPYIGVCARAAASRTCSADWVLVQGNRA